VDWPFQFWDVEAKCTINTKLERFNTIGLKVFVIAIFDSSSNGAEWKRVEVFGSSGHVAIKNLEL
jgi:hypothetical protein